MNGLASVVHKIAAEKGYYDKPLDLGRHLAYIHGEVSEAVEAERRDKFAEDADSAQKLVQIMDGLSDEDFMTIYTRDIKGSFEEEMADIVICTLAMAGWLKLDIHNHVLAKLRYNEIKEGRGGKTH